MTCTCASRLHHIAPDPSATARIALMVLIPTSHAHERRRRQGSTTVPLSSTKLGEVVVEVGHMRGLLLRCRLAIADYHLSPLVHLIEHLVKLPAGLRNV